MEIIYKDSSREEGNDCMIYTDKCIIELGAGNYLAVNITTYQGWMGTEAYDNSKLCEDLDEAYDYLNIKKGY